jgi:polysaccharide export outer membrane protein
VSVLGEVRHAASVRFRPGFRLTDALALAGGTSKDADEADVRIIRGPLSGPRVYRASLEDIVDGRSPDVELAPGDVVFVTEHWFASTTDVLRRLSPLIAAMAVAAALSR